MSQEWPVKKTIKIYLKGPLLDYNYGFNNFLKIIPKISGAQKENGN
jgi:hypothetical protein